MNQTVHFPCLQKRVTYHQPDQSSPKPPIHSFKIHFNIILPATPTSSKWPLPSDCSTKTLTVFLFSPTCHTPHLYLPQFYHSNHIWNSLTGIVCVISCRFLPLRPKYLAERPIFEYLQILHTPTHKIRTAVMPLFFHHSDALPCFYKRIATDRDVTVSSVEVYFSTLSVSQAAAFR